MARPHTRAHGTGARNKHMSLKQIHDVTTTDLVLRSHSRTRLPTSSRIRDTANEELSTVTEDLTKLNDMCAVETELDDTRHPERCAQP